VFLLIFFFFVFRLFSHENIGWDRGSEGSGSDCSGLRRRTPNDTPGHGPPTTGYAIVPQCLQYCRFQLRTTSEKCPVPGGDAGRYATPMRLFSIFGTKQYCRRQGEVRIAWVFYRTLGFLGVLKH
jgi:hypothetical protein